MDSKVLTLIILLMVGCLGVIASDIYTPSLPAVAHYFSVSSNAVQWSMPVYMLGLSLSMLVYGAVSDAIGRRKPLLIGLVIALIGTLVCAFSTSITILIIGRFIQGCGAGAGAALWRAIFRDIYSGDELVKYASYLTMIVTVVLPAAPALGGYLQQYIAWEASFIFIALYIAACLLIVLKKYRESSQQHQISRIKPTAIKKTLSDLLSSRCFLGSSLCVFLCYGAFFSWDHKTSWP